MLVVCGFFVFVVVGGLLCTSSFFGLFVLLVFWVCLCFGLLVGCVGCRNLVRLLHGVLSVTVWGSNFSALSPETTCD